MTDDNTGEATQSAENGQPGTEAQQTSPEAQEGSEGFSREYVQELRDENRQRRQEASEASQRADFLATEVRRLATREATRGILADPEALPWSDEFAAEDGLPDPAKITAAAEALATVKPWLARVRGSVRQGEHGTEQQPASLSELLRAG